MVLSVQYIILRGVAMTIIEKILEELGKVIPNFRNTKRKQRCEKVCIVAKGGLGWTQVY